MQNTPSAAREPGPTIIRALSSSNSGVYGAEPTYPGNVRPRHTSDEAAELNAQLNNFQLFNDQRNSENCANLPRFGQVADN